MARGVTDWVEIDHPKVWVSRFFDAQDLISFEWSCDGDSLKFIHSFRDHWRLADPMDAPKALIFRRHKKIPASQKDAFMVVNGVLVVSQALRDILVQFNIGETQLFEVPIHADDKGTPSGLPNHFVLNVHHHRPTLIVEKSLRIEQPTSHFRPVPPPDAPWEGIYSLEELAVDAGAIGEADLWHDPRISRRFFLSDRLKQAIDAAGLKVKAMDLYPALVFEALGGDG